jgi:hypothetical protein
MIYPASYDITILQNATWRGSFRATQNRREINNIAVVNDEPVFEVSCHDFIADDKVVLTGGALVPCGLSLNEVYYVIASGLTDDNFQVSATISGSSITVDNVPSGTFFVARPVDLTTYTIDSDIKGLLDDTQVGTFTPAFVDAENGEFTLTLPPAESEAIPEGRYGYDVSLTAGSGDRYYWLTGVATVQRTYSRN